MANSPKERDSLVIKAKLAEQTERYDDMREMMKKAAERDEELSDEERNLLSVAYKNVVGARRSSWRMLVGCEGNEKMQKEQKYQELYSIYRQQVEQEIRDVCDEVQCLLDKYLIKNATTAQCKVFYLKMKGDYFRYVAEVTTGEEREKYVVDSRDAYEKAVKISQDEMPSTDCIRLGLALNFSVFYYEILNNPEEACKLAKEASDEAIKDIQSGKNEDSNKDTALILQLLRDNLELWTSCRGEDDREDN
ncbi:14-3-3 protein beta/alpha-like [Pholidichthys leucotaenia]